MEFLFKPAVQLERQHPTEAAVVQLCAGQRTQSLQPAYGLKSLKFDLAWPLCQSLGCERFTRFG